MMAELKSSDPAKAPVAAPPQERRRKRASHGMARLRLQVPHGIEGYYIRWVNDDGKEVEWRLQNDYQFVEPKEVGFLNNEESRVKELVGTKENGEPLYAYLMKIRQDWRDEDVAEEQELQRRIERQLKGGTITAPGESAEKRYIPKDGISIA